MMKLGVRRAAAAAALSVVALLGTATVSQAAPADAAPQAQVQAAGQDVTAMAGWVPVAAFPTYQQCAAAAAPYGSYATCSYVGGSYPYVLWLWQV
ncbi:hypothetical protein [Streptomyces bambusae]|uniref:Secreted protein n=1 Tax=Streptomyces bambusae TaxID=1550616 RepID=A0ABS6ZCF7_9ACTN|nr:hypothetical protein [Streptomyces bambusae]MBW5485124.1 hypothetical protein [Streptomyces bambusae]